MSRYFELEIVTVESKHVNCVLYVTSSGYLTCNKPARFAVCGDNGMYLWRCGNHRDVLSLFPKPDIRDYTTTVPQRKHLTEAERIMGTIL